MDGVIDSVLGFVQTNRDYAFWIALLLAAAETTAFVSILIPSTGILMGVGALVATGQLSMLPIWAGAAIGALIGSGFSYYLGRRFGMAIFGLWPLRNHPEMVDSGNRAFRKHGPIAVLIGHFFGPLRAVVFVMAGMAHIPLRIFLPINLLGCVVWAYVTPAFGEVAGYLIGWIWTYFGF
jgi:membrane protein DedA with SNARE-associated domain